MKVSTSPRRQNSHRDLDGKRAPAFLQWLRGRQCLVAMQDFAGAVEACQGRIEAAHVDYAGGKGVGTKVADRYAVPLCSYHHAKQHALGWRSFDNLYLGGFQAALLAAAKLWNAWPGRIAHERKLEARRAG